MTVELVGIGVGPSNLSLACLLHPRGISNLFFDRRPTFTWHEGMQIPGVGLQVSFIKDLVTLAEPTNPFSFLSFLHENRRLYHFLNAQFEAVSRREFSDYFTWAARKNPNIKFGEEVVRVRYDGDFVVETMHRSVRAASIAIGVGKTPYVPEFARDQLGSTQYHSANYAEHRDTLGGRRVTVVGSGQSGAEIVDDLLSRSRDTTPAHVTWVSRRTGFGPLDDAPFTNDLFMPDHQEYFVRLAENQRRQFLKQNVLASDGISLKTLRNIYQKLYTQRFVDRQSGITASLLPNRTVVMTERDTADWLLVLQHGDSGETETVRSDVIIWATGYRNAPTSFMREITSRIDMEGEEFRVDDSFAAQWDGPSNRPIFILNASQTQKGLADPNLSLLAWRSARIVERLSGEAFPYEPAPSLINWMTESIRHIQVEAG
ncbi:FAD-NAD(P)-binding family protein [Burkholderia gladioli]|uniref:lysine N(6)-hydroxylase/L-ornithine N(5)-oxygenase family protein n=1 Tax=Burkholderia gladioli TaxID=28095 RepID=UPI001CB3DBB6|nr:SidA/IucD/PvdA family monooxygenase [Burkholderia gladioli]CAG9236134.1 FAD-NAD(P)-binding family protein [Burkholderia gladioli]